MIHVGKNVEKPEASYTSGGNGKWFSYFEVQLGGSSED